MRRGKVMGAAALAGALALSACGPKAGLFPLDGGGALGRRFGDDREFRGMEEAVRRSREYYRSVPGSRFRYGDLEYSAAEMEASMSLFLDILALGDEGERERRIRERFLFFESRNERGRAFFTGYYEPVLPGSLEPAEGFSVPAYGVPEDLLTVDLEPYVAMGVLPEGLPNRWLKGKLRGRKVVPYDGRDEIAWGDSLEGRARAIVYLPGQVELAFLQIQGSGLVRLGDGTLLRLNYADQNGHPYRPVGRVLLDRIPREEMSLQRIREHLRSHPEEVREVLGYNPSYTFFRLVEKGPLGNIQVPLTPGRSLAMDWRLVPKGGLAYFETSYPRETAGGAGAPRRFGRFGVVQDTGGAIRGHGRADIFWGSGDEAERIAGPMKEEGRVWLLVARKEYLAGYLRALEDPFQQ